MRRIDQSDHGVQRYELMYRKHNSVMAEFRKIYAFTEHGAKMAATTFLKQNGYEPVEPSWWTAQQDGIMGKRGTISRTFRSSNAEFRAELKRKETE